MPVEIERRFLLKSETWRTSVVSVERYRQCYLVVSERGIVVRVRISKNNSYLTLKIPQKGISNYEFEYSIPMEDAEELWSLSNRRINKNRHFIALDTGDWIVDCFEGDNYPLMIAEVEIPSEDTFLMLPEWCAQEVTGVKSLSNASLAKSPFSTWSFEKRKNLNLHL